MDHLVFDHGNSSFLNAKDGLLHRDWVGGQIVHRGQRTAEPQRSTDICFPGTVSEGHHT